MQERLHRGSKQVSGFSLRSAVSGDAYRTGLVGRQNTVLGDSRVEHHKLCQPPCYEAVLLSEAMPRPVGHLLL